MRAFEPAETTVTRAPTAASATVSPTAEASNAIVKRRSPMLRACVEAATRVALLTGRAADADDAVPLVPVREACGAVAVLAPAPLAPAAPAPAAVTPARFAVATAPTFRAVLTEPDGLGGISPHGAAAALEAAVEAASEDFSGRRASGDMPQSTAAV